MSKCLLFNFIALLLFFASIQIEPKAGIDIGKLHVLPLTSLVLTLKNNSWLTRSALGGTRTPNLLIRSQMLYPLSYKRWET
jgi:hypothetical protein